MTARERKMLGPTLAVEVVRVEAAARLCRANVRKARRYVRVLTADRDQLLAALIVVRDNSEAPWAWRRVDKAIAGRSPRSPPRPAPPPATMPGPCG